MPRIKHECRDCAGTGLYQGFCEAKNEAVVCLCCAGRGYINYAYKPFTGRRRRKGVSAIRFSRGASIMTGVGGVGTAMTYKDFEKKIPVTEKSK